jgi:quinoprotein glucose dehydrogenase
MKKRTMWIGFVSGLTALTALALHAQTSWPSYGGDSGGSRYSEAKQINRENVARLQVAWMYRTGDISDGSDGKSKSKFEATPIFFNGVLYLSTPFGRVISLDPSNGRVRWIYDPEINLKMHYSEGLVSRGVSSWEDSAASEGTVCKRSLFLGTLDARLVAIDAASGKLCPAFGRSGQVDLKTSVGKIDDGEFEITSPPAVVNGVVVVGSAIGDNRRVDSERGTVRGFDARTGAERWAWNPLPEGRVTGAANAWSAISADPSTDLLFVPTGSASPDFFGGQRPGDDLFANSVVALRASTGRVVWHFQVVHHDLWDYDVASQPLLTTVKRDGKEVPAVVVNTKMGHVFVLDRATGKPLFPVEEREVPKSDVEGENPSRTQPFPVLPPPLYSQTFSADQAFGANDAERDACKQLISGLRYEGIFTPPTLKGTMIFPGYIGGVNWGSAAADASRGVMTVNVNNIAFWVRLIPRDQLRDLAPELRRTYTDVSFGTQAGTPYAMARGAILSPKGNPCTPQPWGKTIGINLNTGAIAWESAGTFGFGGPMMTAGGLVFTAGGVDQKFRALNSETGKELWSVTLPVAAQSTPMTYQLSNGKQYIVVAAGGHGSLPVKLGDYVIAYALP